MDPEKYKLCSYEQIPLISKSQFQNLLQTRRLVLHYNLIVDYEGFNHPGYFKTIDQFKGKQISEAYTQKEHSFNADLIICHKTVGKLENSDKEDQGHNFYDKIKDSQINQNHEKVMSKFDFSKPIFESIQNLHMGQLFLLTQIPKFFKNPSQVVVSKVESFWDAFFARQHIWFCSGVFFVYLILITAFIAYNYTFMEFLAKIHFIFFGYIAWTLIQYYIHRYDFHHNMFETKRFKGSDFHHAFPTLPGSLSVSISSVTPKLLIFIAIFYVIIDPIEIAQMLLGVCFGLILYNFIHYNAHYGPELNIGWIKAIRTHHLNHHFKDQHSMYGITCLIWDHLYKTMKPKLKYK